MRVTTVRTVIRLLSFVVGLSSLASVCSLPFEGKETEEKEHPRYVSTIINGQKSANRKFFVQIVLWDVKTKRVDAFCGGTFIDEYWILSAAHCFMDKEAVVVLRADWSTSDSPFRFVSIEEKIIHPGFTATKQPRGVLTNDIALIKVNLGASESGFRPLVLCTQIPQNFPLLGAIGLGRNSTTKKTTSKVLLETFFYDISNTQFFCRNRDHVCVVPEATGNSICNGDSGGPLFIADPVTREPVCLYGVSSSIINRESFDRVEREVCVLSFFQSVYYHHSWIIHSMRSTRSL